MKPKFNPSLAARFTSTAFLRVTLAMSTTALIMAAGSAKAASSNWAGNTDANWGTPENWDFIPVSNDDLIFDVAGTSGPTLNNNLTINVAFTIAGITFNATAPAYTISGNAFTLGTGIANNSTALQTINDAITVSGATTFTAPGGGGIALGAITTAAGSSIDLASGTSLSLASLNGGAGSNNRVNVTSAGSLTVAGSFHVNNNVAGAGSFTQTAGTVTLSSAADAVVAFGDGISLAFRAAAGTQNIYALQGGTLNAPNASFYVSSGGGANGLLSITGGTANLRGITLSGTSASAVGAVSLTGGRLNLGANGLVRGATTAAGSTVTLGAGTVGTSADWSSSSAMILSDVATGVTFDTTDVNTAAARTITLSGVLSGAGALKVTGTGRLTLTGANTYIGDTTVNAGTLVVNGTSIGDAQKLVITGGKVEPTGTETVGTLFFGAVQQIPGTWGSTLSAATNKNDTYFSGTGVVSVPKSYSFWAIANAGSGLADGDSDNDGARNGVEYFMNATGGTFTANPGVVAGVAAWTNGGNIPSTAYGTQFVVQTSPDLGTWTNILITDPNLANTSGSLAYTLPTGAGKLFVRLLVTPN